MDIQNKIVVITHIIINLKNYKMKRLKEQLKNRDMEIF